ncbi:collagen alpha-1(I) chain-like [Acinonyx jubatus]|uniref:Collagen alpha-1(I) chain-like n=1 Tax=Acinonyx jubatus TaxID=32536 RepID=A0A6J1Y5Q4_ACIJB|nr:collagen alpha-1(I) chain-like [Acinonyx jubatus]
MVARGARTKRGPGPLGRPAQRRPRAPARIGGWAGLGPRCLPRCAALRVRLLICSAAAAAAAAAARSQTPGTVRGVGKKLEEFARGEGPRRHRPPNPYAYSRRRPGPGRKRPLRYPSVQQRSAPPWPRRSALHVGTQRRRRPSPDVALAPQLAGANGTRLRTELWGSRTAEPFPEVFNPRDEVKVIHSHREEKQVHGKLIWERHARTNVPHTKASPSFRLLPTFPAHKALRSLAVGALSTRPRVWQCTERVSLAHVWCTQQRSLDSHPGPRGPTYAQGPRGPPGSRAAPRTESEHLATRPTSRPLLAQPHGARASPSRGAAVALGLPAEAHLQSFSPSTEIPGLQRGRRSLRFLQTPRRTLPPLPPPALGLQQPCRHPECVAWRPHPEGFASGQNPDPGHPRRRGPAASRAAPERAAAPHQPPGPRSRSLRPEKRRENFGRNFANFALGEGEAARPAAAAAGRDAQSGPQVRPGHPGACRAAQGGVRGRLAAPGTPLRPRASPTWPWAPRLRAARDSQSPGWPGSKTWPSTQVI